MRVVQPGEPFGELCFCATTDSRRHSFSRARVDCSVLEISSDDFYAFVQNNRQVLLALTYTFCVRLSTAEQRLQALTHRDAEGRLGRVLVSLATGSGADPNAAQVLVRITHQELAHMAAMNRAHVTVTLGKFREQGLVAYERGRPLAVNIQKLMVYLELPARAR